MCALFVSCGKDNSSGQDRTGGGDGRSDGENTGVRDTYFSDIREALVPICSQGQIFAFEKCWGSVEINDNKTVILKNTDQSVTILQNGQVTDSLMSAYDLSDSCEPGDRGPIHMNFSLHSLPLRGNVEAGYWFLPGEFRVYNLNKNCHVNGQEAKRFRIDLINFLRPSKYWYVNGTLNLCGKRLILPLMQKDIESACGVFHGRDLVGRIQISNYYVDITYNQYGLNPGQFTSETNRMVSQIQFSDGF